MDENENFIHNKYGYCYYEIDPVKNPIIYNLFVHPPYRRNGHARKLLQYVINEIKQTGHKGEIVIQASPKDNSIDIEKLANFYTSMGLKILKNANTSKEQ